MGQSKNDILPILFPKDYNYVPKTYFVQHDWEKFKMDYKNYHGKKKLWIYKPTNNACGRGIKVFSKIQKTRGIKKRPNYIISEYLSKPHLLNGFKYDLRLYVVVVGLDPLRVYLHKEGLVRICTHKYSTK